MLNVQEYKNSEMRVRATEANRYAVYKYPAFRFVDMGQTVQVNLAPRPNQVPTSVMTLKFFVLTASSFGLHRYLQYVV